MPSRPRITPEWRRGRLRARDDRGTSVSFPLDSTTAFLDAAAWLEDAGVTDFALPQSFRPDASTDAEATVQPALAGGPVCADGSVGSGASARPSPPVPTDPKGVETASALTLDGVADTLGGAEVGRSGSRGSSRDSSSSSSSSSRDDSSSSRGSSRGSSASRERNSSRDAPARACGWARVRRNGSRRGRWRSSGNGSGSSGNRSSSSCGNRTNGGSLR